MYVCLYLNLCMHIRTRMYATFINANYFVWLVYQKHKQIHTTNVWTLVYQIHVPYWLDKIISFGTRRYFSNSFSPRHEYFVLGIVPGKISRLFEMVCLFYTIKILLLRHEYSRRNSHLVPNSTHIAQRILLYSKLTIVTGQ